jgi:hypothetical protein
MGSIHNELRRGPWSRAATAILGDTREGSGIERLGESMTPSLDLWSPARPDWAIYRGEQLVYLHDLQAAVAAEFGCIVFEAPPNPVSILTIDFLEVTFASEVLVGYDARPAGSVENTTTKDFLDQRARPTAAARPRSRVFADSNVGTALTGPFRRFTPTVSVTTIIPGPFVLLGNNLALIVEGALANVAIRVSAVGRERDLLSSERE